jgi:Spy/CpxP family protein refolding chaperone
MSAKGLAGSWGAAVLLLVVFVSGALVGAAGMRVLDGRDPGDRVEDVPLGNRGDRRPRPPRVPGGRFMEALGERLDLTDAQQEEIETILEGRQRQAQRVFESIGPRMRASIDSMEAEIRAVLTEEQQAAYADLLAESRGREGWDGRRGPPGGRPFPRGPNRGRPPPNL